MREKNANVKLRNGSANFLITSISFSLINPQIFLFKIKYYLETEIHDIFSWIPFNSEPFKLCVEFCGKEDIIWEYKGLIHAKHKKNIYEAKEINTVCDT